MCGKDLKHLVPDDAEEVTCFNCAEGLNDGKQIHDAKPRERDTGDDC